MNKQMESQAKAQPNVKPDPHGTADEGRIIERFHVCFKVLPMGKPRMTQRDVWKKRSVVLRYHAFKDNIRRCVDETQGLRSLLNGGTVNCLSWTTYLPIPMSWTKKKKAAMAGALHRSRPDRDNIDKAILDSLFKEDSGIASGKIEKRWDDGAGPRIEATFFSIDDNTDGLI